MPYTDHLDDVVLATMAAAYPNGQVEECGVHMLCTVTGLSDTRLTMAGFFDSQIQAHIVPLMATTALYYGTQISLVRTPLPYASAHTIVNTAGGGASHSMPTQVRPVLKWFTELVGRKYRGRLYGFTPDDISVGANDHPSGALIAAWNTVAANIQAGFTSAGSTWKAVIWHRDKTLPFADQTTLITAGLSAGRFGTQKRSGDYGRVNALPW